MNLDELMAEVNAERDSEVARELDKERQQWEALSDAEKAAVTSQRETYFERFHDEEEP